MRTLILLITLFLAQGVQDDRGIIEGTVSREGTSEPIPGATVVASPQLGGGAAGYQGVTDASGRFSIPNVAWGPYFVSTQAAGYARPAKGGYSARATIGASQRVSTVSLTLVPQATLRGTVTGADGLPANGIRISALGTVYWGDQLILGMARPRYETQSNARGEFQFPPIDPGEYYVAAPLSGFWFSYDKPGSFVVAPRGGNAEVRIETRSRATFSISGKIVDGVPGPEPRVLSALYLMSRDTNVRDDVPRDEIPSPSRISSVVPMTETNADIAFSPAGDQFVISNVHPGQYDLFAMLSVARAGRSWVTYMGRTAIEVTDRSLNGVAVEIRTGVEIVLQMKEPVNLYLSAAENTPTVPEFINTPRGLEMDGKRMYFSNVPPGTYRLLFEQAAGRYIADIRQNGQSIVDSGRIVVGTSPISPIDIIIETGTASLQGVIRADSNAARYARVGLVPEPPRRANAMFYKSTIADINGRFVIEGIAPGDYKLFALEEAPSGALDNPDFIQRHESLGTPISIRQGEIVRIDANLIPAP